MPVYEKYEVNISSLQNPRIKSVVALRESKERRKQGLFTVEGAREIDRALRSGWVLEEIFYCKESLSLLASKLIRTLSATTTEVNIAVMQKLLVRDGSDGLLAVFKSQSKKLEDLPLSRCPLFLAVENLEKPGNLGALLRSADAAGCDGVIVLEQALDLFNPQTIRSSLGTVFSVPVVSAGNEEFKSYCEKNTLRIHAAALRPESKRHYTADLSGPCVILLGSEATGLSDYWLQHADVFLKIPMLGIADSLNAAAAGAVLIFEALRQRQKQ